MTHRTFERPDRRYCRWAPLLYQTFTEEYTNPRERILGSYKTEDGTLPEALPTMTNRDFDAIREQLEKEGAL